MRPYTGTKDPHPKKRPGTQKTQDILCFLFGMKNLGLYANRETRSGSGLSVHATWRAGDTGGTREQVKTLIEFLYTNRDILEIEEIHDYRNVYIPGRFGAGYRCDRDKGGLLAGWKVYTKPTIGTGGSWVHWEISPRMADDVKAVEQAFATIFAKP